MSCGSGLCREEGGEGEGKGGKDVKGRADDEGHERCGAACDDRECEGGQEEGHALSRARSEHRSRIEGVGVTSRYFIGTFVFSHIVIPLLRLALFVPYITIYWINIVSRLRDWVCSVNHAVPR